MGMGLLYLALGLAVVGGICWALTQITVRQRRLQAELTRLERLAAEVAMNADAILDRVDDRVERLQALLATVERAASTAVKPGATPVQPESAPPEPMPQKQAVQRPVRPEPVLSVPVPQKPVPPPKPVVAEPVTQAPQPTSAERYRVLRARALELSDSGIDPREIARRLGIPWGEVQLILNLQGRMVDA